MWMAAEENDSFRFKLNMYFTRMMYVRGHHLMMHYNLYSTAVYLLGT